MRYLSSFILTERSLAEPRQSTQLARCGVSSTLFPRPGQFRLCPAKHKRCRVTCQSRTDVRAGTGTAASRTWFASDHVFTVWGLKISQGCALPVQTSRSARNQLGSSRLPARIPSISGRAEVEANRGDPHFSQNPRRTALPLSAVLSRYRGSPLTSRNAALGIITVGE